MMDGQEQATKKGMGPLVWIIVLVVLIAGGYWLFSNNQQTGQEQVTPTPTAVEEAATEASPQTFDVAGANFKFTPNEIKVKKGTTVKINFSSAGGLHDFVLDEFNVKTERVSDGETDTVEFIPDKVGTFEFYCSVGNHRQMGMVGNLVVEE